jgi:outer membrane protein assembly factor BamB
MMNFRVFAVGFACALPMLAADVAQWPQFRGPGGSGLAGEAKAPVSFQGASRAEWKADVPAGQSSPSVWGDRIFLTAGDVKTKKLELLCLDRKTGKVLWRRAVTAESIEHLHEIGTPATATPAVDGERVYAYFGSYGLLCFDFEGNQKWSLPLPVANTPLGSGTSPIVAGDAVILNRDDRPAGYLLAVDRQSGKQLWKQPYTAPNRGGMVGAATPVVWKNQVIVHRGMEVVAFDTKTGSRQWWVTIQSTSTSTPVVGPDAVYVASWINAGEPDLRVPLPDFESLLKKYDKDGDGMLSADEFPNEMQLAQRPEVAVAGANLNFPGRAMVQGLDRNGDGKVDKAEWDAFVAQRTTVDHGLVAIKPGGQGDVTATHALWREARGVPEVPTPLYSNRRVYMVTNGGIVTAMDAATGQVLFRKRLGAGGAYYASPVMAGGNIYFISGDGVVSVIRDAADFQLVAKSDLEEPVFATLAIVDGIVYVRTATHLYAFAK